MRASRFSNSRLNWKPAPDVLSKDEIRWWLNELRRRGWGTRVLGRTMGLANEASVWRKANGKEWIFPTEQIRMSYVLKRIISGELVCIPGRRGRGHQGKAVLATNPQPLTPPTKLVYDRTLWRCRVVPAYEPPQLKLPDFKTLLDNPPQWKKRDG